jgi:hypothetical protein
MHAVLWHQGCKPDLCTVDECEQTVAVLEYESINSSDERLMGKDLDHFEAAIGDYAPNGCYRDRYGEETFVDHLPPWWILISTLPNEPVQRWPWWGWNTDNNYEPRPKSQPRRNANPFTYYEAALHADLEARWKRLRVKFARSEAEFHIAWVNLEPGALRLVNLDGARVSSGRAHSLKLK